MRFVPQLMDSGMGQHRKILYTFPEKPNPGKRGDNGPDDQKHREFMQQR